MLRIVGLLTLKTAIQERVFRDPMPVFPSKGVPLQNWLFALGIFLYIHLIACECIYWLHWSLLGMWGVM